jgi:cellulase/cellobiase CelA1
VSYVRSSQWTGGAQIDVTVRSTGTAVNGWTLAWDLPAGQQITQSWNATVTQSGQAVRASNVAWNAQLPAGFGFIVGTTAQTTGSPTAFTLNNSPCRID